MENREKMKQILKCPLCFGIVTNPITCPRCNVFICKNCLKDFYLNKKKTYCPACKEAQRFDEYYPIPIMDHLSNVFIKNQNEKFIHENRNELNHNIQKEMCEKHNYELLFYCLDCDKKLCGECIETFNKKLNKHATHNVYNIKDLIKYNLFEPIELYKKLNENKNSYKQYINKCDYNLNFLNVIDEIRKNHLNRFQDFINEQFEQIIQKKAKIKENIKKEKKQLGEEFPPLNSFINEILKEKGNNMYNNLINKIKEYKLKADTFLNENTDSIKNEEINILSIDLFESQQFSIENININIDKLGEKHLTISNLEVDFSLEIIAEKKITFETKIKRNDDKNGITSKYLVAVIIKNYYKNQNDKILLREYMSSNISYYSFSELYSKELFVNSLGPNRTIYLNIIISRMIITFK